MTQALGNSQWLERFCYLVLLVIAIAIATNITQCNADSRYQDLLTSYDSQYEEIVVVRNKTISLRKLLAEASGENDELLALVSELRDRPADIRYVVETVTVLQPQETVYVTPDIPQEYLFQLDNGLVTARFGSVNNLYVFETYGLVFESTIVLGKNHTSQLLLVSSEYDDDARYEVPVTMDVRHLREHKVFEPNIAIGVTASLPVPDLTASLILSYWHPKPQWDVGAARVSLSGHSFKLGLDFVGYNVGSHTPILTDLWLYPGVSVAPTGVGSLDLTIGTKF